MKPGIGFPFAPGPAVMCGPDGAEREIRERPIGRAELTRSPTGLQTKGLYSSIRFARLIERDVCLA